MGGREPYGPRLPFTAVDRDRLVLYLAAVFAGLTVLLAVAALARQPFLLVLALPFGATTYFLWFHATGRLAERTRRRTAREHGRTRTRAAADAGPRENWERTRRRARRQARQGTNRASNTSSGPTRSEAYRALDLEPGASEEAVRRAYREKVKEVHPDAESGDEESFKRVNRAYEALTD